MVIYVLFEKIFFSVVQKIYLNIFVERNKLSESVIYFDMLELNFTLAFSEMDLKYRIVTFLEKPKNQKLLDVDIIPMTWLVFKENDPGFYCKFMKGPFPPGRAAQLKKMVMNCESPEKDWPIFAIDIRGRAGKFCDCLEIESYRKFCHFNSVH